MCAYSLNNELSGTCAGAGVDMKIQTGMTPLRNAYKNKHARSNDMAMKRQSAFASSSSSSSSIFCWLRRKWSLNSCSVALSRSCVLLSSAAVGEFVFSEIVFCLDSEFGFDRSINQSETCPKSPNSASKSCRRRCTLVQCSSLVCLCDSPNTNRIGRWANV